MKQRPMTEAIEISIRQQQDHAQRQGRPRPDTDTLRTRFQQALSRQDQKNPQR